MKVMETSLSDKDLEQLVLTINNIFDFDFSGYAPESLKRRFSRLINAYNYSSVYDFQFAITNGLISRDTVLNEITVNVTDMFRDPEVFHQIVMKLFPYFKSFPRLKVWHAGCSTGQEMYSLAILLKEHDLLHRTIQYGTDINTDVLKIAKEGIYELVDMRKYSSNYLKSGGQFSLSDYYTIKYNLVKINSCLKKNMVFSCHDLVKSTSFNEFQLIVCRNVLIYFNRELQNQVLKLLIESLVPYGYLVLGDKETISFYDGKKQLEVVDKNNRIFRKRPL
jgi:chemotaxis protein methyltransferase CheR